MGDRANIIVGSKSNNYEVSPCIYTHWGAEGVPQTIRELKELMSDRKGDVTYAAARLTGIIHSYHVSSRSLGISNVGEVLESVIKDVLLGEPIGPEHMEILRANSPGDGGLVIVDCDDFSWVAFDGYLEDHEYGEGELKLEVDLAV